MKMFVPTIGSKICLTQPWTFGVWGEKRNNSLGLALGIATKNPPYRWNVIWKGQTSWYTPDVLIDNCTLPVGTVLTIDRIYIRKGKGMSDFDSMSFRIKPNKTLTFVGTTIPIGKGIRFWAKLDDCNQIEFEPAKEP